MLSSRNLLLLTGLGALIAIMVLFAGITTHLRSDQAVPLVESRPLAPATTSATPTTTTAATTTTTTTTTAASGTDSRGFVGSDARCDDEQSAVALGRTQRSQVVICAEPAGGYEYRGVRISDGAALTATAEATGEGSFVARGDGSVYTVSPSNLTVTSGGKVIYRDTWITYQAPSFAAEHGATSSAATSASTATSTSAAPKPR